MSAKLETEVAYWETPGTLPPPPSLLTNMTDVQLESLFSNLDARDMVAPLREACEARISGEVTRQPREKSVAAIALQEQWCKWLEKREQLQLDIKRGKECLAHARSELQSLRIRLDEWPLFERHCGVNPLTDYIQEIAAKERITTFLPHWLRRQEQQLASLNRRLQSCAKQNGLEHLL